MKIFYYLSDFFGKSDNILIEIFCLRRNNIPQCPNPNLVT